MELVLLTVADCPHAATFEERLAAALADRPDTVVCRRVIASEQEAAQEGMHGSPTLLVDGADPFAEPGQPPSLSCRLYRDVSGRTGPVPSVQELRRVLAAAGDDEPGNGAGRTRPDSGGESYLPTPEGSR